VQALRRFERRCYVVAITDAVLARSGGRFRSDPFARLMPCTLRPRSCSVSRRR
jgi:hypothetical protein